MSASVGLEWKPKFVSLDFEIGAIQAFLFCFSEITIVGCWFHYGQCIFKKIIEIGLKSEYGKDEELKKLVQNCIALALCHPDEVVDIFISHIVSQSVFIQRKYPRFNDFINYMTKTWIEGEENGPLFKIIWWNHWHHIKTRTNNTNEAYNFRLVVKMGSQLHPNIWLWVEFIQEEDLQMSIKFTAIEKDVNKNRSRALEIDWRQKDCDIADAKCDYLESSRSSKDIDEYLAKMRVLSPKATYDVNLNKK